MTSEALEKLNLDKADEVLSFTMRLLSQFSGARLDPYTALFARRMCREFSLSVQGQRTYNNALNNLPLHRTPDDDLCFGWGLTYLIRNPQVHQYSYEHLTLCSALGDSFAEAYVASVLSCFADVHVQGLGLEVTPQTSQFQDMVHGCNGILTTTDFGLTVDDFLRLNPHTSAFSHDSHGQGGMVPAEQVARALNALGKVTSGREKEMTLIGGDVAGWFAAAAETLFSLGVRIVDKDGKELYTSQKGSEAQVKIVFAPNGKASEVSHAQSLTGALYLEEVASVSPESVAKNRTFFGGRIIWQSLLPKVFGQSFYRLDHTESKTFGTAIGCVARGLERLTTNNDPSIEPGIISNKNKSNSASWGLGLIETITNWLPELRRFQGRMERMQKLSFDEANTTYVEHIRRLEDLCGCCICSSTSATTSGGIIPHPLGPSQGYCLLVMVETIIALGLLLSRIIVSPQIYPSHAGIKWLYGSQVKKRLETKAVSDGDYRHFMILHGNEWNAPDPRRLQNSIALFSGSWPTDNIPENLSALSHEGICAYVLKLEKLEGSLRRERDDTIRIVTGGINYRQKMFSRACLGSILPPVSGIEGRWEEIKCQHLSQPLFCK